MSLGDIITELISDMVGAALGVFETEHSLAPGTALDTVSSPPPGGTPATIVLRDSPVMTLTAPPAGSPPGSVRLVTRGSLSILPHLTCFVRLEGLVTHTHDHIDTAELTSFSADARYEQENVFTARLGVHFDLSASGTLEDLTLSGMASVIPIGLIIDVTIGISDTGFFLQGDIVFPVSIPLVFTGSVLGAAGFMLVFASEYGPDVHEDDDTAAPIVDPTALDYVKWATGPFLSHPVDAWRPSPNSTGVGAGFILEDFPARGKLLGLNPVGFVATYGADGLALMIGGHGAFLKSTQITVDAFMCFRPSIPDFAIGGKVAIKIQGGGSSGPSQAQGTPPEPKPVAPGTTDPPPAGADDGDHDIFSGEGKFAVYVGPSGAHVEIGTPLEPVTVVFLRQFGPHGLCQAQFFLVVDTQTGTSFGVSAVFGFDFGSSDTVCELAMHIDFEVFGIFANAPRSFEGRFAIEVDIRVRVSFMKLGIIASATVVAFHDPSKDIFDLELTLELPWPLPTLDFHTSLTILNDPLPPEFNPPMLVGAFQVGADD